MEFNPVVNMNALASNVIIKKFSNDMGYDTWADSNPMATITSVIFTESHIIVVAISQTPLVRRTRI